MDVLVLAFALGLMLLVSGCCCCCGGPYATGGPSSPNWDTITNGYADQAPGFR